MKVKNLDWIALIIVFLFFLSCVLTLREYGLSWDEGLGNLFFGERYLLFFTSLQDKYLDFKAQLPFHDTHDLNLYASPFRNIPYEFPPVADTLSAGFMYLFSYKLGWLGPVDAWHLFTVFLASLFLLILYRFASRYVGKPAALFGIIFLASFPRYWGDAHFNPKDVPETVFFSLVILAYYSWYRATSYKKALGIGILFGLALGIKLNALFIPFVLVFGIWPLAGGISALKKNIEHLRMYYSHYGLMAVGFLATYFFSWPYLYKEPQRIFKYLTYMFSQGGRGFSGSMGEALLQAVSTIPELFLVFLLVGILLKGNDHDLNDPAWHRLLVIWMAVPLVRANLPGITNFDGIRHFLEFVPAAALLAGRGVIATVSFLGEKTRIPRTAITAGISVFLLVNLLQLNIVFSPYQHLYYNLLVGGLNGAEKVFGPNEATDYWATGYRQGMEWLNEHASPDALLYTPVAPWLVELTGDLWLRQDIQVITETELTTLNTIERDIYVMFITRPVFYDRIALHCVNDLVPIYQVVVDRVSVMEIYQLE